VFLVCGGVAGCADATKNVDVRFLTRLWPKRCGTHWILSELKLRHESRAMLSPSAGSINWDEVIGPLQFKHEPLLSSQEGVWPRSNEDVGGHSP
jgi:hypothetical protein